MKLKKKAAEMSQRELARFIDYSVLKPEFIPSPVAFSEGIRFTAMQIL